MDDQFQGNLNVQGGNPGPNITQTPIEPDEPAKAAPEEESEMSRRMNEILGSFDDGIATAEAISSGTGKVVGGTAIRADAPAPDFVRDAKAVEEQGGVAVASDTPDLQADAAALTGQPSDGAVSFDLMQDQIQYAGSTPVEPVAAPVEQPVAPAPEEPKSAMEIAMEEALKEDTPPVAPSFAPIQPNAPVAPVAAPEMPVEQPVAAPEMPVEQPVVAPEMMVEQPIAAPEMPVEQPIAAPEMPVEQSVAAPVMPMEQPVSVAEMPMEQPVAAPEMMVGQPVTAPEMAVEQSVAMPEMPAEPQAMPQAQAMPVSAEAIAMGVAQEQQVPQAPEQMPMQQPVQQNNNVAAKKKIDPKLLIGIIAGAVVLIVLVIVVIITTSSKPHAPASSEVTQGEPVGTGDPEESGETEEEMQRIGTEAHGYVNVPQSWERKVASDDLSGVFEYKDADGNYGVQLDSRLTSEIDAHTYMLDRLNTTRDEGKSMPQMAEATVADYEGYQVNYYDTETSMWFFEYAFQVEDGRTHIIVITGPDQTNSVFETIRDSFSLNQN